MMLKWKGVIPSAVFGSGDMYLKELDRCRLRPVKRPKLRLWLSPILPQLRLGKKIFHAKFWASEIAGTFVRVRLKFVLN